MNEKVKADSLVVDDIPKDLKPFERKLLQRLDNLTLTLESIRDVLDHAG